MPYTGVEEAENLGHVQFYRRQKGMIKCFSLELKFEIDF